MIGKCSVCTFEKKVQRNKKTKTPVCRKCQRQQVAPKTERCSSCGQDKVVYRRVADHQPLCKLCGNTSKARYHDPRTWKKCAHCGAGPKPVAKNTPEGPQCHNCYTKKRYVRRPRPEAIHRLVEPSVSQRTVVPPDKPEWLFCGPCGKAQPDVVMVSGIGYCKTHFIERLLKKIQASRLPPQA